MSTTELNLFSTSEAQDDIQLGQEIAGLIEGLNYTTNFVTVNEEQKIIKFLDDSIWSCELARRVQHYGFKYDYKSRRIDENMRVGDLPIWLKYLAKRLVQQGVFDAIPDQVIVNEYLPGQGISAHIDCQPCFGDTIASLSLNSTCVLDFNDTKSDTVKSVLLEPRSVVVLKKDARYFWKHSIAKRKQDTFKGVVYPRNRRISLTFRKIKWE